MSDVIVRIISFTLAAVFAWAAVAKAARFRSWQTVLARYRLPSTVFGPAAVAVPLAELGIAALLVAGATRAGAALSVSLLSAFSLVLLRARSLQGDRLPCGCFGAAKERDYRLMLLRNGSLAVLAAALLLEGRDVDPTTGIGLPSAAEAVPAVLTVAGLLLIMWMGLVVAGSFRKGRP
jgi:hypothetical protein